MITIKYKGRVKKIIKGMLLLGLYSFILILSRALKECVDYLEEKLNYLDEEINNQC